MIVKLKAKVNAKVYIEQILRVHYYMLYICQIYTYLFVLGTTPYQLPTTNY